MGTKRSEMKGFVNKSSAQSGSSLIGYSYAPTDGFLQNTLSIKYLEDDLSKLRSDRYMDGSSEMNDDRYRTSAATYNTATRRKELSLARQLSTKKDQSATIRLVAKTNTYKGSAKTEVKSNAPLRNVIPPYTKFFLENVSEDRMEKAQVIETFGEFIAFFFGRRPEVYQFSGRLLNAKNHDWKNDFQEVYDNFLRGTKAVEYNATVLIQYDDVLAEGFLMNCHLEYHGVTNNECPFSFAMLVTNRAPINQLQRLQDRRARSRFSAAEQQLLDDLSKLQNQPVPFSIMQKALSTGGLNTSDIVLHTTKNNKITSSDKKLKTLSSDDQEALDIIDQAQSTQAAEDAGEFGDT